MVGREVPFYNTRSGGVTGYIESLKKYQDMDIKIIIPSHGDLIKNPAELITQIFEKLQNREKRLLDFISKGPAAFIDMLPVLFRNQAIFMFPGTGILNSHLDKLIRDGIVKEEGGYYSMA